MPKNLHSQIRLFEDQLSRSERRLSDAVFRLGHHLPQYSSAELAEYCKVSSSTVTRFFRKLGYQHYRHALKEARLSFIHLEADALDIKTRVEDTNLSQQLDLHLNNEIRNISDTLNSQNEQALKSVISSLASCEKVWVVGFADDYALAHLARSLLIRVKSDIRMIPLAGFSIAEEFSSINSSDVVLAFTRKNISHITMQLINSGQLAGADIIQIGGQHLKLLPNVTQLSYSSRGEFLFDSFSAAISLISYICSEVATVLGQPALARLHHIESLHDEWDNLS